ncbi:uncharacterized protein LOC144921870 [Branchiostoma floridae x Branchiostoma belcheri]
MGKGPCLRFSTDRQTYQDARDICQAEGGRLVVIKSAALDAFIDNRIQTTYDAESWIGLDDLTPPPSQYVWSDGSVLGPTDFSDWSPIGGQPDTIYGEKCAEIRPQFNYQWNNHHCWRLKHYICESCPQVPLLPTDFDYAEATSAITGSPLNPAVAEEVGLGSFLNDLAAYAEYDGTPLADLPDTDNIVIMPERWALTYTNDGVTTGMFLPQTKNFNPGDGLPDQLPSVALAALRERYPLYYAQYLSNIEADYRNSRADMEFDCATYGPDADCPYPLRTDLGGDFALERIPPSLCSPDAEVETRDPVTGEVINVVTGRDIVRDGVWVDVAVVTRCDCLAGPADIPPCIEVLCFSPPPYINGDTCAYTCKPECLVPGSTSNLLTCNNGDWIGDVPYCPIRECPSPPNFYCTTRTGCSAPYIDLETCTYTCNDTCVGNPNTMTRTCRDGSWHGEDWAGCSIILHVSCELPPTFPCTSMTCTGTDHGDVCTYECDRGCTGTPSIMTRTCEDGEWVGEPWEGCQQNCNNPPSFPCAIRSGCASPYTHGETCTYACNRRRGCAGIPAATTRTCTDGVWVGPDWNGCHKGCRRPPRRGCAIYTCDQPGSPYPDGTTCTYQCDKRRGCAAIPATATATCHHRQWTGPDKSWKCKKGCGLPPSPPCTEMFGCSPFYKYGESCEYRCYNEGGYAMEVSGDRVRTCEKTGDWSGTDLVCDCKEVEECCRPDIIFVLDYSGSMWGDIPPVIDFVTALVDRFEIGDLDALVGVVRYNTGQMLEFHLNAYNNKAATLAHISGMTTTPGGGTLTGAALTYVANTMLLPSNGNRPDAPDVVIVLTDGFSWDSVAGPASVLHSMGVQTFAIGVGSCVSDAQLHDIANCDDHVYKLADFRGLENITAMVHDQICCDEPIDNGPCPDNYVSFEGTCLRFSDPEDARGFSQAQETCQAEGSRLVVIKSAALDAFIDNQIQSIPLGNTWIGLSTPVPALPNQWTDGSTLLPGDYRDWYMYETDLAPGELCTDIRPEPGYNWHTDNCQVRKNYICEYVEPPCCPRPPAVGDDPGYACAEDHKYRPSPQIACRPITEEIPAGGDGDVVG